MKAARATVKAAAVAAAVDHGNMLAEAADGCALVRMQDAKGNEMVWHEPVAGLACDHGVSVFAVAGCVECMRKELDESAMLPENFVPVEVDHAAR